MARTTIKKSEYEQFARLVIYDPEAIPSTMGIAEGTVTNYINYAKASTTDRAMANRIYCKLGKKIRRLIDKVIDSDTQAGFPPNINYKRDGHPKQIGPQQNSREMGLVETLFIDSPLFKERQISVQELLANPDKYAKQITLDKILALDGLTAEDYFKSMILELRTGKAAPLATKNSKLTDAIELKQIEPNQEVKNMDLSKADIKELIFTLSSAVKSIEQLVKQL